MPLRTSLSYTEAADRGAKMPFENAVESLKGHKPITYFLAFLSILCFADSCADQIVSGPVVLVSIYMAGFQAIIILGSALLYSDMGKKSKIFLHSANLTLLVASRHMSVPAQTGGGSGTFLAAVVGEWPSSLTSLLLGYSIANAVRYQREIVGHLSIVSTSEGSTDLTLNSPGKSPVSDRLFDAGEDFPEGDDFELEIPLYIIAVLGKFVARVAVVDLDTRELGKCTELGTRVRKKVLPPGLH
ncbi:hypothetical protein C8R44DRAFT_867681 [Mycena epipterygia]|nr:hypothetical protein C8R44DRAFT_867681 [Mycena epipterygia]